MNDGIQSAGTLTGLKWKRLITWKTVLLCVLLAIFIIVMIFPLASLFSKAFLDSQGNFAGLSNYRSYFSSPSLSRSIWNTIDISLMTTLISVTLGFMYAFALTRTNIRFKTIFRYLAMIPIFIPTVVHALGLVYIFGRQGILTRIGVDIELYGRLGIIISEVIFTFPPTFMMFFVALEFADGRLYEAADSMGVKPLTRLFRITLPEVKYTLINAAFVCFTLAFTDFGAPKVLGGGYNVLATDIYKQIVGQFNMNMGAVVGTLLLIPAGLSFIADRITNNKNASTMSAKSTKLVIKKSVGRDIFYFVFCSLIAFCFLALVASLIMGALATYYPYNMTLTLKNFVFDISTGGLGSFANSITMSFWTALIGTAFVFVYAYMMEKSEESGILTKFGKLLSVLPMALPGMVIGISFIFFFNAPENPLNFIYGTGIILVLSNILHYFSVPFLTATGALKKLDKEFESVSDSMSLPRWKLFLRVSVPLSLPAILEIFMYYFVNGMVTVSALVFLYGSDFRVASIAITHMEEAGNISQAAAMSLLILLINVVVRLLYEFVEKIIKVKSKRRETV